MGRRLWRKLYERRRNEHHPVYGQTSSPTRDARLAAADHRELDRALERQAIRLATIKAKKRLAELELLEELGKLSPYDVRELARLREGP